MEEISPALTRYDIVEPTTLSAVGNKVQLLDANKGSKPSNTPLTKAIENFYFTDAISRSSATMGRCSAAKESKNDGGEVFAAHGHA
jgi:NADH dehydrogenase (ubiquinone) Fe-S protein 1